MERIYEYIRRFKECIIFVGNVRKEIKVFKIDEWKRNDRGVDNICIDM